MELHSLTRFSHCGRIFFVPERAALRCAACGDALRLELLHAPVLIRSPLADGHGTKFCFLVSSSRGAVAFSEHNESELHVGISNSEGVVFSYTESGVQQQQWGWEQSVVVPLVAPSNLSFTFKKRWDGQLETFASEDTWTADRFQEKREFGSCCYGFALGFINHMRRSEGNQPISREHFTAQYVLPRLSSASTFLSIYQHVSLHGFYGSAAE